MAQPILLVPGSGQVEFLGEILCPGPAPMKIDLWRHVRYPPPQLLHVTTIKPFYDRNGSRWHAGEASALIGKILTWRWDGAGLSPSERGWRVRIDVWQDGVSAPGYPVEYHGPLPRHRPLTSLRITEPIRAVR